MLALKRPHSALRSTHFFSTVPPLRETWNKCFFIKYEWPPQAKTEHINQNENDDCGAKIISFSVKVLRVLLGVEMSSVATKSELWYELESEEGVRCCDKRKFWMKKHRRASKISGWHGVAKCIITCEQQMRGAVPVLCLHATVFTATNEQQIGLSCTGCCYNNAPKCWMCQRAMQ